MSKFVSCQGATPLTELGKITMTTEHKPNCVYAAFYVIAGNNGSLFYREASNQLNFVDIVRLITIANTKLLDEYHDLFVGRDNSADFS